MTTPGEPNLAATGALAVRQSVNVELPPSEAFRLFTDGIGEWWPLAEGYSYGGDRAHSIFLEPVVGGRFFERFVDGDEMQVGTVLSCSPPDLIVFTWRSPEWRGDTEVDVRFVPEAGGLASCSNTAGGKGSAPTAPPLRRSGRTAGPGSSPPSHTTPPSANDTFAILPARACYRPPVHVCCRKTANAGGMLRSDPRRPSRGGKRRVRRSQGRAVQQ
jgi:uncharacterized protein YndB with AHSA1/START domain